MVERRWAMTKTVRPVMRLFSALCTSISDSESSSEVASSRIRIGASFRSARAMARRCRENFVFRHVGAAVAEIVPDGVVKQNRFLRDDGHLLAQRTQRDSPHVT